LQERCRGAAQGNGRSGRVRLFLGGQAGEELFARLVVLVLICGAGSLARLQGEVSSSLVAGSLQLKPNL